MPRYFYSIQDLRELAKSTTTKRIDPLAFGMKVLHCNCNAFPHWYLHFLYITILCQKLREQKRVLNVSVHFYMDIKIFSAAELDLHPCGFMFFKIKGMTSSAESALRSSKKKNGEGWVFFTIFIFKKYRSNAGFQNVVFYAVIDS